MTLNNQKTEEEQTIETQLKQPIYCGDFNIQDFIIRRGRPEALTVEEKREESLFMNGMESFLDKIAINDSDRNIIDRIQCDKYTLLLKQFMDEQYCALSNNIGSVKMMINHAGFDLQIPRFAFYSKNNNTTNISLKYENLKDGLINYSRITYDNNNHAPGSITQDNIFYNKKIVDIILKHKDCYIRGNERKDANAILGNKLNLTINSKIEIVIPEKVKKKINWLENHFGDDCVFLMCDNKIDNINISEERYKTIHDSKIKNIILGVDSYRRNDYVHKLYIIDVFNPLPDDYEGIKALILKGEQL